MRLWGKWCGAVPTRSQLVAVSIVVRLGFLLLGYVLTCWFHQWKYTDVDYEIYADAADLLRDGSSPYERITYRYSPLLAMLLAWYPSTLRTIGGKVLFIVFDSLIPLEILMINRLQISTSNEEGNETETEQGNAMWWAKVWALNPLSSYIATRGSCDSLSNYLVLLAIRLALQKKVIWSGLVIGLVSHLRVYPVIYVPTITLFIARNTKSAYDVSLFVHAVWLSLASTTIASCAAYGVPFLENALFYHLTRADHRHNFSVAFYSIYLRKSAHLLVGNEGSNLLLPTAADALKACASTTAQLIAMWTLVRRQFCHVGNVNGKLCFALLLQTAAFVAFNKVITGQYFLWALVLVPVSISGARWKRVLVMDFRLELVLCAVAFLMWLLTAFLLEMYTVQAFFAVFVVSALLLLSMANLIARVSLVDID